MLSCQDEVREHREGTGWGETRSTGDTYDVVDGG
jgi:hypothetical protein